MSYDIYLRHRNAEVDENDEISVLLGAPNVAQFLQRLAAYRYVQTNPPADGSQFLKHVDGCPIQVTVFPAEIAFSVPYWDGAESAIFEALQDATELVGEFDEWSLHDPQEE